MFESYFEIVKKSSPSGGLVGAGIELNTSLGTAILLSTNICFIYETTIYTNDFGIHLPISGATLILHHCQIYYKHVL